MTHPEVQVALMEIALELRRIDRRLDDLAHVLDEPTGPRSLAAPEVEEGSDRPLNLAAAVQAQIVYTREAEIESAIQDLCLVAQLSDDPDRWRVPREEPCRRDVGAASETSGRRDAGAPGQERITPRHGRGNGAPDLAEASC
ncbi:MAG: hypothetical protein V3T72_20580 [Thermoanaerobaculia bacterium]